MLFFHVGRLANISLRSMGVEKVVVIVGIWIQFKSGQSTAKTQTLGYS
jgi:hypothetical protein